MDKLITWNRLNSFYAKNKRIIWPVLVLIIAFFTFFHNYTSPKAIYFDEAYHMASAEKYVKHVMFMEPHPPLGKLLMALGEVIIHPNNKLDLSAFLTTDGISDYPPNFSPAGMRFFPVLLASLSPLILYFILLSISKRHLLSFLFTFFFLFENSFIVHMRTANIEGTQIFLILLDILIFVKMFLGQLPKSKKAFLTLGVIAGLAVSAKFNSLILLGFPFFLFLIEAIRVIKQRLTIKAIIKDKFISNAPAMIGSYAVGFALIFCFVYFIHFSLGERVLDDRYYEASDEYKTIIDNGMTKNPFNFIVMLRDNLKYSQNYERRVPPLDLCKEGEIGSAPLNWLVGGKAIKYRSETNNATGVSGFNYLMGNPIIWFSGLLAVVTSFILVGSSLIFGLKIKNKPLFQLIVVFLLGYLGYMATVLPISRVLYLYHYFIPLLFSFFMAFCLCLYGFLEHFQKRDKIVWVSVLLFFGLVFAVYLFFSPLSYNVPIPFNDFIKRDWFSFWGLNYVR